MTDVVDRNDPNYLPPGTHKHTCAGADCKAWWPCDDRCPGPAHRAAYCFKCYPRDSGLTMARPDRAAKVEHVRRAPQTREHTCHWPGCTAQVPPAMWGCKPHWMKLPKPLRDRVWAAYRPGQETDMEPSAEYLAVADDVQRWIRERTPAPPAQRSLF